MEMIRRAVQGRFRSVAWVVLAVTGLQVAARGDEPFSLGVQTTTGTPQAINVSGNSLRDLAEDLVRTRNRFAAVSGQAFDASVRYGGLNNAATYTQNAEGTSATLRFPTTGFTRTFTAANQDDLEDQIEEFVRTEGADEYFRFLRTINERTQLGVTDGNPLATTALLSDLSFDQFGLHRRPFLADPAAVPAAGTAGERVDTGLHFDFRGGVYDTDEGSGGWHGTGVLTGGFRFTDRVGLTLGSLFSYRDVEGASVYHSGFVAGLPILLVAERADNPWSWQVTPAFLAGASGSEDLAAGGTFLGGSVTSSVSVRAGRFTFTLGNQISFLEGFPISFGEYDFETDLSQQILKNGVKASYDLGPAAFVDAGVTYTNFLQDAAVDSYWSPTVGLGFRFGDQSGVRVAYQGDFGDGFEQHGGSVLLYLNR